MKKARNRKSARNSQKQHSLSDSENYTLRSIVGPAFLLVPIVFYAFLNEIGSGNSEIIYRLLQLVSLGLLFYSSFNLPAQYAKPLNPYVCLIVGVLFASYFISVIQSYSVSADYSYGASAGKILLFSGFILAVSRFNDMGFQRFLSFSYYIAVFILAMTVLILIFSPTLVYGRHFWFGLHPNLGGEVIFFCLCVVLSRRLTVLNAVVILMAFYAIALLESRAALVACLLVSLILLLFRVRHIAGERLYFVICLASLLFFYISFGLLVNNNLLPYSFVDFVLEDVFRVNDAYRGYGSGLVGRDIAYSYAQTLLNDSYFLGVGIDRAYVDGHAIHNGFLKIISELGFLSFPLLYMLFRSIIYAFKYDHFRFSVLIGCSFVFYFSDRGFNTSVFPLILWITILQWRKAQQR